MENLIGVIVLVILTGGASAYLIRAKKKGVKCVGCPAGGSCCSFLTTRNERRGSAVWQSPVFISGESGCWRGNVVERHFSYYGKLQGGE